MAGARCGSPTSRCSSGTKTSSATSPCIIPSLRPRSTTSTTCGVTWGERRLTVNLSPADLRKTGTGLDLALALAVLGARGRLGRSAAGILGRTVYIGELGLDGSVHSVRGVLPSVQAAVAAGVEEIVVAQEAAHLTVFQRSPAYTLPWKVRRFEPGELDDLKARYPEIRAAQREHPVGAARLSAFSVLLEMLAKPPLKSASREERTRAVEEGGVMGALNWGDLFFDIEANRMAAELYGEAIARIVENPDTARALTPSHPFACKRPIIDQGYYETYNRDNVSLVAVKENPIEEITPRGVRTADGVEHELDVLVFATGFDAVDGNYRSMDLRGRGGQHVNEHWADAPKSYLGVSTADFPNMFMILGPNGPFTNLVPSIETQVEFITDVVRDAEGKGGAVVEATHEAEEQWTATCNEIAHMTVFPKADSWIFGANIPGKKKTVLFYMGGLGNYRDTLQDVEANDFKGFAFSQAKESLPA